MWIAISVIRNFKFFMADHSLVQQIRLWQLSTISRNVSVRTTTPCSTESFGLKTGSAIHWTQRYSTHLITFERNKNYFAVIRAHANQVNGWSSTTISWCAKQPLAPSTVCIWKFLGQTVRSFVANWASKDRVPRVTFYNVRTMKSSAPFLLYRPESFL